MFGKKNGIYEEEMARIQQKKEAFDRKLEESNREFDKAMESQKKADKLMLAIFEFMMNKPDGAQKDKFIKCLEAVQEDERLQQNQEVQKLVRDIYRNMDDVNAMMQIVERIGSLLNVVKKPVDVPSFSEIYNYFK